LHTDLGRPLPPESDLSKLPLDPILSLACPLTELVMVSVPIRCDHISLVIRLNMCDARSHVYISDIDLGSTCSKICDWCHNYKGAYLVQINGHPVLSEASTLQKLTKIVKLAPTLSTPMLELIVAPNYPPSRLHSSTRNSHLKLDQFRTVIHARYEMVEIISMPSDEVPTPDQLKDLTCNITVIDGMVHGSKWTRRQIKRLRCWPELHADDKEQLNGMALVKMFGKPDPRPTRAIVLLCMEIRCQARWVKESSDLL
jgi:hypothetical protein